MKINLTKDCSVVSHLLVVVNSIASLPWGILFWHQFPMQMFCSSCRLVRYAHFLFYQAMAYRRPLQILQCCGVGRMHKHTEYENLLWVLQTIPFFWQKAVCWIPVMRTRRNFTDKCRGTPIIKLLWGTIIYTAACKCNLYVKSWKISQ